MLVALPEHNNIELCVSDLVLRFLFMFDTTVGLLVLVIYRMAGGCECATVSTFNHRLFCIMRVFFGRSAAF